MSLLNFFSRKFRKGSGSSSVIYVPLYKYSETKKRYVNLLDLIHNTTQDFQQILIRLMQMTKTRMEFQKLDFGSFNDAYQITSFMEAGINAIAMQIESTIQYESRCREEILEKEDLYFELTTLSLNEDQQSTLLEFEKIHQSDYLAKATSACEDNIVGGHNSKMNILVTEHDLHSHKVQRELDHLAFAQIKSANFKAVTQSEQKRHFKRKVKEHPGLSKLYMDGLQRSLDRVTNIKNGLGTSKDIELVKTDSNTEIN